MNAPGFLSVCSGIEAASVAWHPLGWRAVGFAELAAFPRALLTHHYPGVPLHGDFVALIDRPDDIVDADVLVGGTPCQAFSLAGHRRSLADERGNLSLQFTRLAHAIDDVRRDRGRDPCVIVWENVPGVLSTRDNAFGCFLAALVGEDTPLVPPRGGKWTDAGMVAGPARRAAWRLLDAQYFGLAQRRERVFVVASARTDFDPAEILFEPESLRRHHPPRRAPREGIGPTLAARTSGGGGLGTDAEIDGGLIADTLTVGANQTTGFIGEAVSVPEVSHCLNAGGMGRQDSESETLIAHALRAEGFDASEDGTGRGTPLVPIALAFDLRGRAGGAQFEGPHETANIRAASNGSSRSYVAAAAVRRITPRECERLQGFPDDYTLLPFGARKAVEAAELLYIRLTRPDIAMEDARCLAADGPRYKSLGNSMAVPVMAWLGDRIDRYVFRRAVNLMAGAAPA